MLFEKLDSLSKLSQSAVNTDTAEETTADEEGEARQENSANEISEAEAEVEVAGDRPRTENPLPAGDSQTFVR